MNGAARTGAARSDIARIEAGTAPAQIDRKDLERVATIGGDTAPELSISEASAAITDEARRRSSCRAGYIDQLGGETEQLAETAGYVVEAILLAVILIFLILASQFESFTQPFAIMLSLPLSLVGVLLALLVTGTHDEHDVDDRRHHADGARGEERDSARGQRQRAARGRRGAVRRRSSRRARCDCGRS